MNKELIEEEIWKNHFEVKDGILKSIDHFDYEDNPDHWSNMTMENLVNLCNYFYKIGSGEIII